MSDRTQHLIEQGKLCGLTWATAPACPARRAKWEDRLRALIRRRRRDPFMSAMCHWVAAAQYAKARSPINAAFEAAQAMACLAMPRPCHCEVCR